MSRDRPGSSRLLHLWQRWQPPVFTSRADDSVVRAAVSSFADGSSTRNVWPEAGLIPPVQGAGCIGSDSLSGGMGVSGFLHRDDGSVVVLSKSGNSIPVGLEAGDVKADKVNGGSRAVSVCGARISPAHRMETQQSLLREGRARRVDATTKAQGGLRRG